MPLIIYFFGSSLAFYTGAAFILFATLALSWAHSPRLRRTLFLAASAGITLVIVSATPLPYWYYGMIALATLAWLVMERRWQPGSRLRMGPVRIIVSLLWLGAAACEGQYLFAPTIPPLGRPPLWIIGDSVTAGIANRQKETWPNILARTHDVVIHDRSQAGATVRTAWRSVENVPVGDGIVLLEIGGNDMLGGTPVAEFEENLDRLLAAVCQPGRTVLMFELPLLPFHNEFGRSQRRQAASHGVLLIPKRCFVEVLTASDATLDGVHLSQHGHDLFAEMVWRMLGPAYEGFSSTPRQ